VEEFQFSYEQWYRWLAVPLGLGPNRAVVRVGDNNLHVEMGWAFKTDIPLASITDASRGGQRFVVELGVHGRRGDWLVNGSSNNIVELAIDPPVRARAALRKVELSTLRVSVSDPDSLIAACTRP
jgi:hypothetical protein